MPKSMTYVNIKVPVRILAPKLDQFKQDSLFYAGQDIAKAKILDRDYVLTTAGMYDFTLINGSFSDERLSKGKHYKVENGDTRQFKSIIRRHRLTDARIKSMTDDGNLVSNWGWFGINVWDGDKCLDRITDAWSTYDEAMTNFLRVIREDLELDLNLDATKKETRNANAHVG